jgi:tape measure domain-containing protein
MTEEEILVFLRLQGQAAFIAGTEESAASVRQLGVASEEAGLAMAGTARRGYIMNQALFTMRRLMYGATLAIVASGIAAVKWGYDFNSAMQSARVALQPVAGDIGNVQDELDYLFNFTKHTPFQFKDVTIAFRQMYLGMRTAGISAETVNTTLHSIVDALSATGRTSPGALNRVAVALQHMAYQGHLTGQTVNQLARDGLPIFAALTQELGLTADQMHHVGNLGIPVQTALKALNDYIENTPGFMNAAYRQSLTVHGLFTTLKDNISQLAGHLENSLFLKSGGAFARMNAWFDSFNARVTNATSITSVVAAIDPHAVIIWKQVADDLHLLWQNFSAVISALATSKPLWGSIYIVLLLLHGVLMMIVPLTQKFGWFLYILIPLLVTYWGVTKLAAFWTAAMGLSEVLATKATKELTFFQFLAAVATGRYALMTKLATFWTWIAEGATWLYVAATTALADAFTAEGIAAGIAWAITLAPITIIVAAIAGLVILLGVLYFKWDAFHDLVNRTWNWVRDHKLEFAAALTVAFFPLVAAYETLKHIYSIWNALRGAWHWLTGSGNAGPSPILSRPALAGHPAGGLLPLASPGNVLSMPSLKVPSRASNGQTKLSPFNYNESWMNQPDNKNKTTRVKVQIGRKVLADVVAEEIDQQQARK